jgi:hypothetical protein
MRRLLSVFMVVSPVPLAIYVYTTSGLLLAILTYCIGYLLARATSEMIIRLNKRGDK